MSKDKSTSALGRAIRAWRFEKAPSRKDLAELMVSHGGPLVEAMRKSHWGLGEEAPAAPKTKASDEPPAPEVIAEVTAKAPAIIGVQS